MNFLITAFNGFCMALADSVPGVSGGTIAFILGFYEKFIGSIHGLSSAKTRKSSALWLVKLLVGWIIGFGLCMLVLSNLFEQHIYFMSSMFLGLTLASIPFIAKAEAKTLKGHLASGLLFGIIGAAAVIGLTLFKQVVGFSSVDFAHPSLLQWFYLLIVGMVAISAMVLPGISGSTVLMIFGVYLPAITAAKQLLHFDWSVLPGVMGVGLGILLGIAISIHFIQQALKHHRPQIVSLILGLMVGSLVAIVMGPTTLKQPLPALSLSTFDWLGCVLGVLILVGLEALRRSTEKRNGETQE